MGPYSAVIDAEVPASWRPLPCPFCLMPLMGGHAECQDCSQAPPRRYVDALPPPQPLALQLLGAPTQGKSAYLQALLFLLPRLTRLWSRFAFSPATEDTRQRIERAIVAAGEGRRPEPTRSSKVKGSTTKSPSTPADASADAPAPATEVDADAPEPIDAQPSSVSARDFLMLLVYGLPLVWGTTRTLVLHDLPGAEFSRLKLEPARMPFVHRAPRCLMFFKLPDIEKQQGDAPALLMAAYVEALLACGIQLRDQSRQVIVVLTHAESARTLPASLRRYLIRDPVWATVATESSAAPHSTEFDGAHLRDYLHDMRLAHDHLRAWLSGFDAGNNFLRLAAAYGVDVRLSLVSASGAAQVTEAEFAGWQPHRILDPLLWALELDREARALAGEQPS